MKAKKLVDDVRWVIELCIGRAPTSAEGWGVELVEGDLLVQVPDAFAYPPETEVVNPRLQVLIDCITGEGWSWTGFSCRKSSDLHRFTREAT